MSKRDEWPKPIFTVPGLDWHDWARLVTAFQRGEPIAPEDREKLLLCAVTCELTAAKMREVAGP
jgi:hypothetical protein